MNRAFRDLNSRKHQQCAECLGDIGVTSKTSVVQQVIQAFSGLDYLVNNAGVSCTKAPIPRSDLDRLTEDFWNAILTTNLIGPFRCVKAAAEALRQSRGAIVNTASTAGVHTGGSSMAYSASKAGLINLTKNLARGLAPDVALYLNRRLRSQVIHDLNTVNYCT